jgi:hypothetical protein
VIAGLEESDLRVPEASLLPPILTMGYTSPHPARDYLIGASLFINHDYIVRTQFRTDTQKKALVRSTREIDLCARLASFFGPTAHLAAQGTNAIDLVVRGPTIRAEVKYVRPKASAWAEVVKDWNWLLSANNVGEEFKKRAWVVFFPSIDLYRLTECISVPKNQGTQYSLEDYAPFTPFAEPEMPPNGSNQRLRYKTPNRTSIIFVPGGRRVRVDIVGTIQDPIWCAIYTRVTPNESSFLSSQEIRISTSPITI